MHFCFKHSSIYYCEGEKKTFLLRTLVKSLIKYFHFHLSKHVKCNIFDYFSLDQNINFSRNDNLIIYAMKIMIIIMIISIILDLFFKKYIIFSVNSFFYSVFNNFNQKEYFQCFHVLLFHIHFRNFQMLK